MVIGTAESSGIAAVTPAGAGGIGNGACVVVRVGLGAAVTAGFAGVCARADCAAMAASASSSALNGARE
jgi:hypothetical protein